MTGILRVYDPPECDLSLVPLDWEQCRTCEGTGRDPEGPRGLDALGFGTGAEGRPCPTCDGHGSLKAAALDLAGYRAATKVIAPYVMTILDWRAGVTSIQTGTTTHEFGSLPIRCEDCGHPMSEGTWEGEPGTSISGDPMPREQIMSAAPRFIAQGIDLPPSVGTMIHYSPCDEGCRHGGPGRASVGDLRGELVGRWIEKAAKYGVKPMPTYEASWRPVDVRTLSYPNVLLPEKLAVLCLRCYAERSKT